MHTSILKVAVAASMLAGSAVASAALASSGVADITGTWSYDLDTGAQGNFLTQAGQDIWWEQMTSSTRQLVAVNGAQLVNLGVVDFASITLASLQGLTYGTTPIVGSNVGNELTFGDVFAVKTNAGNYAKVLVSAPYFDSTQNNGLVVYYQTFAAAVPEPTSVALALAGVGMVAWSARRKKQA